jgi:hypothetical protein
MTHAPFSSADPRKQIPFSGQFADIHCGAEVLKVGVCSKFYSKFYTEVLKVGVCSKFYRSDESGCLQ